MPSNKSAKTSASGRVKFFVRLTVAVILLWLLFYFYAIDWKSITSAISNPRIATTTLTILSCSFVIGWYRWLIILRAFKVEIGPWRVFEIYAISSFFNVFLPGVTGGDAIRVIYSVRAANGAKVACGTSVLLDRILGFYGMLLVTLSIVLINFDSFGRTKFSGSILTILAGSFVLVHVAAFAATIGKKPLVKLCLTRFEGKHVRLHRFTESMSRVVDQFQSAKLTIFGCIILSISITCILIGSIVFLSIEQRWGEELGFLDFATAASVALMSGTLPITPGGIGTAEGVFSYMCSVLGEAKEILPYATAFFLYRLFYMCIYLTGGILFITRRR